MKKPKTVCYECGVSANVLTSLKRFKKRPNSLSFELSTFHQGTCDFCQETKSITQARDFFNPDFSLLEFYL